MNKIKDFFNNLDESKKALFIGGLIGVCLIIIFIVIMIIRNPNSTELPPVITEPIISESTPESSEEKNEPESSQEESEISDLEVDEEEEINILKGLTRSQILNLNSEDESKYLKITNNMVNTIKNINEDSYGYIIVTGTDINWPMVQTHDNEYYMRKDIYKNYDFDGVVWVDYENGKNPEFEKNLIVYGHNTGEVHSKFYTLFNLQKAEVFNESLIIVYTANGIYVYEPFAEYITDTNFFYIQAIFPNIQEFINLANQMKSKSINSSNIVLNESDHIITLSTCTNRVDNERFVVNGKLIKVIK